MHVSEHADNRDGFKGSIQRTRQDMPLGPFRSLQAVSFAFQAPEMSVCVIENVYILGVERVRPSVPLHGHDMVASVFLHLSYTQSNGHAAPMR